MNSQLPDAENSQDNQAINSGRESVQTLSAYIRNAKQLVEKFPQLHPVPIRQINLNQLADIDVNARRQLLEALSTLESAVVLLGQRLDLPVLVGMMGKFASGKSTLLNAFFNHAFDGNVPPNLQRKTGKVATDRQFTYITHSTLKGRFEESEKIAVVEADNDLLRIINFIDTPGTGWSAFTQREVSDLLSAADLILFVLRPGSLLDAESLPALELKFTNYANIPLWYVFTHAEEYATYGDFATIDWNEFETDLRDTVRNLRERASSTPEDARAKDVVLQNVYFKVNENVFLVDGRYGFETDRLLNRILNEYGSANAHNEKRRQINISLQQRTAQLNKILVDSEHHLIELSSLLRNSYLDYIRSNTNTFLTNRVNSAVDKMSTRLLSQADTTLPSLPSLDTIFQIPAAFGGVSPEVSILRNRLAEMQRDRLSPIFKYNPQRILFDPRAARSQLTILHGTFGSNLGNALDTAWNEALKRPAIWTQTLSKLRFDTVLREFDNGTTPLIEEQKSYSSQREFFLSEQFRRDTETVSELYSAEDLSRTIFRRQQELLKTMEMRIPTSIDTVIDEMCEAKDTANEITTRELNKATHTVQTTIDELSSETVQYLEQYILTPARQALGFLFGRPRIDNGSEAVHQDLSIDHHSVFPATDYEQEVVQRIGQEHQRCVTELYAARRDWRAQSSQLQNDFNQLVSSAKAVEQKLQQNLVDSCELIADSRKSGLQDVTVGLNQLGSKLRVITEKNNSIIDKTLTDGKRNETLTQLVNVIVLILSLGVAGIELITTLNNSQVQPAFQFDPSVVPPLLIMLMSLLVAIWMFSRIISVRATRAQLLETIYKTNKANFLQDVNRIFESAGVELESRLQKQNESIAGGLRNRHEIIVQQCKDANDDIIPRLEEQVQLAAELGRNTSVAVVQLRAASVTAFHEALRSLTQRFLEVENRVRAAFATSIERISKNQTTELNGQISVYQRHLDEIAQLRKTIEQK